MAQQGRYVSSNLQPHNAQAFVVDLALPLNSFASRVLVSAPREFSERHSHTMIVSSFVEADYSNHRHPLPMVTTLHGIRTALHACQAVRICLQKSVVCSANDLDLNAILMSSPEPYL